MKDSDKVIRTSKEAVALRKASFNFWIKSRVNTALAETAIYEGHRVLNSNDTAGMKRWKNLEKAAVKLASIKVHGLQSVDRAEGLLRRLLAAWDSFPVDEQVPEELNDDSMWDAVRALIKERDGR